MAHFILYNYIIMARSDFSGIILVIIVCCCMSSVIIGSLWFTNTLCDKTNPDAQIIGMNCAAVYESSGVAGSSPGVAGSSPGVAGSQGVHSPANAPDPIKVYTDHGYKGTSAGFTQVGDYVINSTNTGVPDNSISAIQVASGWSAELFANSDLSGYKRVYDYSQDNITNNLDNKVSLIRIRRTS
jgi:hypothetical protein